MERARGSLSRSTLLLRESILEAYEEEGGSGEAADVVEDEGGGGGGAALLNQWRRGLWVAATWRGRRELAKICKRRGCGRRHKYDTFKDMKIKQSFFSCLQWNMGT